jgi:hypothetical protein
MDHVLVGTWGKVHTTTLNSKFAKIFISGPGEVNLPRQGFWGLGRWGGWGLGGEVTALDLDTMLQHRGTYTAYII